MEDATHDETDRKIVEECIIDSEKTATGDEDEGVGSQIKHNEQLDETEIKDVALEAEDDREILKMMNGIV